MNLQKLLNEAFEKFALENEFERGYVEWILLTQVELDELLAFAFDQMIRAKVPRHRRCFYLRLCKHGHGEFAAVTGLVKARPPFLHLYKPRRAR